MDGAQRSEVVIAKILEILHREGPRNYVLDFSDLDLDEEHIPFFIPAVDWLSAEGILRTADILRFINRPGDGHVVNPVLTSRGLAVLARPFPVGELQQTTADAAKAVSSQKRSIWQVGEFVGALAGGFTKSMGS